MKRAYEVRIERGDNVYGSDYVVVAATDEEAVRKAKKSCATEFRIKTGWRCVSLRERTSAVLP
jgi:hypothetical protein